MIIEISDKTTIAYVQDKFSTIFPFLKIEFYDHPSHLYEEFSVKAAHPDTTTLGEIRNRHPNGILEFFSCYSAGEVEQAFRKKFDLNAQIFRLQGKSWIRTVGTDKLSMKEQNEIGRKITLGVFFEADSKKESKNLK